MAHIYVIKNKINDKLYVGQCICDVKERFITHCNSKDNIPIHKAIQELGVENFYFEILDEVSDDIRLDVETYYIDKLNTLRPNGYNYYRHSSEGFTHQRHSAIARQKISKSSQKWWDNASSQVLQARADKISNALKGRTFTAEHKYKISQNAKLRIGKKNSFYGKTHSQKTKQKISLANTKYRVEQIDLSNNNIINVFDSVKLAAKYVISNNITNAKINSVMYRIYYTCMGNQTKAYNFGWRYEEMSSGECNDYSIGDEISQKK